MSGETFAGVGVAVVAYEAERFIAEVLQDLVPVARSGVPVLVADDCSSDATADVARRFGIDHQVPLQVVVHEHNLGNGGNQKACMRWAIDQGLDVIVMAHGDAQHPVALVPQLAAPILDDSADVVLGSRMLELGAARAGGMPLGRYIGNRLLSNVQNRLAGVRVSEWYSGFRAYRVSELEGLDMDLLPNGFDFDPAVLLEMVRSGARIDEVPIPTHYGAETSRVRLVRDGIRILSHAVRHPARSARTASDRLVT